MRVNWCVESLPKPSPRLTGPFVIKPARNSSRSVEEARKCGVSRYWRFVEVFLVRRIPPEGPIHLPLNCLIPSISRPSICSSRHRLVVYSHNGPSLFWYILGLGHVQEFLPISSQVAQASNIVGLVIYCLRIGQKLAPGNYITHSIEAG